MGVEQGNFRFKYS